MAVLICGKEQVSGRLHHTPVISHVLAGKRSWDAVGLAKSHLRRDTTTAGQGKIHRENVRLKGDQRRRAVAWRERGTVSTVSPHCHHHHLATLPPPSNTTTQHHQGLNPSPPPPLARTPILDTCTTSRFRFRKFAGILRHHRLRRICERVLLGEEDRGTQVL
ncbi:hypothetical protein O3P69_010649 [Scylla paramamosain]|uniref:Uncharacterized protein n=1 Tax=Scylla paramamosain TaxID=85552 RepID=A0AAW0THE0_SCYPA